MKNKNFTLGTVRFFTVALLAVGAMIPLTSSATEQDKKAIESPRESCPATQEYVTTLEFIRSHKEGLASEKDARTIASKVSEGCKGAAQRFIRITQVLTKAGVIAPNAIDTALLFTHRSNEEAGTFVSVFQRAFLAEYLDLDLQASLQMARSLTTEFDGDTRVARSDFENLLKYCSKEKSLGLPLPQCGAMAARITKKGKNFQTGISSPFIKAVEFISSKNGPNIITGTALKMAEELVSQGPGATENFIQAYRYGVSQSGLKLENKDALTFAKDMAARANPAPSKTKLN